MKPDANRKRSSEEYLLSSVRNALRILRSFSEDETEKRVSKLAVELGIGKKVRSVVCWLPLKARALLEEIRNLKNGSWV